MTQRRGTDDDPGERYSPEPNVLERRAARLLGDYADAGADDGPAAVTAALRRATRRAVALAVAAGVISGGLIGGSEIWMRERLGLGDADFWEALPYWIGWFAVAGVISAVEIAFLYWTSLRGVGRVIATARVGLGEAGYPGLLARGFARGALEFPNPRAKIFGIDPYAYVPEWRLVAKAVAYKLKVGVSSFLLRVFLRRVAARLAIRGLVPLLAGPLYAAWNAFIVWRIMIEARIRAFGPPAIDRMLDECFDGGPPGERARSVILHGVGEMVRRASDQHPNYVYLIARLRERLGVEAEEIEVDWPAHRDALPGLDDGERRRAVCLLTLAAVVGSRTQRRQKALIDEAYGACGLARADGSFKELRRRLVDGRLAVPEGLDSAMERDARAAA